MQLIDRFSAWLILTIQRILLPPPQYTENVLAFGVALPIAIWSLFVPIMPCVCSDPEPLSVRFGFVAYLLTHILFRWYASKNCLNKLRHAISSLHAVFLIAVTAYRIEMVGWQGIWVPAATGLVVMEFWVIARLACGYHKPKGC